MLAEGMSITSIADELGVVKSTVCYHARRLGFLGDDRFARRYDWAEIQRYYDEGHSIRACARRSVSALRAGIVPLEPDCSSRGRPEHRSRPTWSAGAGRTVVISSNAFSRPDSRRTIASAAGSRNGLDSRSRWRFITSTAMASTTRSRTSRCSAQTATARRRTSRAATSSEHDPGATSPGSARYGRISSRGRGSRSSGPRRPWRTANAHSGYWHGLRCS